MPTIIDGCNERGRYHRANARECRQAAAPLVVAANGDELSVKIDHSLIKRPEFAYQG